MKRSSEWSVPTIYSGVRFRSRLEARWAVFFDAIGMPWQFEPQRFVLSDGGWYVPDFLLPTKNAWIECKPGSGSEDEKARCAELARLVDGRVYLMCGNPDPDDPNLPPFAFAWYGWQWSGTTVEQTHMNAWHQCLHCGMYDIRHVEISVVCRCGGPMGADEIGLQTAYRQSRVRMGA